jgi:hypothetical protein
VTVCVAIAALAVVRREKIAFTAKCWSNGNGLSACACVYEALSELPLNYRNLAASWAHDSGTAYAAGVMRLVAAESWRVASAQIERLAAIADRREAIRAWVWKTADVVGWMALREAAPTVAAGLAPVAAALPVVDDALGEIARASAVMDRHCGTGRTFLVQVYETRKAAEEKLAALAALTLEAASAAGQATATSSAATTAWTWNWLRSWF